MEYKVDLTPDLGFPFISASVLQIIDILLWSGVVMNRLLVFAWMADWFSFCLLFLQSETLTQSWR